MDTQKTQDSGDVCVDWCWLLSISVCFCPIAMKFSSSSNKETKKSIETLWDIYSHYRLGDSHWTPVMKVLASWIKGCQEYKRATFAENTRLIVMKVQATPTILVPCCFQGSSQFLGTRLTRCWEHPQFLHSLRVWNWSRVGFVRSLLDVETANLPDLAEMLGKKETIMVESWNPQSLGKPVFIMWIFPQRRTSDLEDLCWYHSMETIKGLWPCATIKG